jgi:hypothetical protein
VDAGEEAVEEAVDEAGDEAGDEAAGDDEATRVDPAAGDDGTTVESSPPSGERPAEDAPAVTISGACCGFQIRRKPITAAAETSAATMSVSGTDR